MTFRKLEVASGVFDAQWMKWRPGEAATFVTANCDGTIEIFGVEGGPETQLKGTLSSNFQPNRWTS